jgi:hypothetical protein
MNATRARTQPQAGRQGASLRLCVAGRPGWRIPGCLCEVFLKQWSLARIGRRRLQAILQYLKEHGERLDCEIAAETGISLEEVCLSIAELSAKGEVIMCRSTRFSDGKKTEGMLCRVSGYVPHGSPGRPPKAPM